LRNRFLYGTHLPDLAGLLLGSGNRVRHIRIEDAGNPYESGGRKRTILRAVSKNRRSRRPL
jgi:hypothetical protein